MAYGNSYDLSYKCFWKMTGMGKEKEMKLFISADIEGVTDVTGWSETNYGEKGYEEACRQMTLETAAACEAALEEGYEVVVRDGHGDARNVIASSLPQGVKLIRGWMATPASMMSGLDDTFDGVMYIGYHAPAGCNQSPLAHTVSGSKFMEIRINGQTVSEFSMNSMWADYRKVPSLLITGDEEICRQAQTEYPGIEICPVKRGIGSGTYNLHPQDAISKIKTMAKKALCEKAQLRNLPDHFRLELVFRKHADARSASWYPGAELVDAHTVAFESEDYFKMSVAFMFMSGL